MVDLCRRVFVGAAGFLWWVGSNAALAATGSAQGVPQYVYTYGNGMMLVTGMSFSGATCSNNGGFVVAASHPHFSKIMALVLAARAQGAALQVVAKIDNCWYPEITEDLSTYIVMLQ